MEQLEISTNPNSKVRTGCGAVKDDTARVIFDAEVLEMHIPREGFCSYFRE